VFHSFLFSELSGDVSFVPQPLSSREGTRVPIVMGGWLGYRACGDGCTCR